MAGELVLITGANGALGYPVVLHALRAGYHVRAAVRSHPKADSILNAPSVQALDAATKARLSFAIVPDLLQDDAYTEALKDVVFAIHVASPIPSNNGAREPEDYEAAIVTPAVKGTINMLEAAERTPSVRRVVVTSSVVAQVPASEFFGPASGKVFTETSRTPDPSGPYPAEGAAYLASKVITLNAAERWVKEKMPRISVVHVHPALTLGRVELATTEEALSQGSSGRSVGYMLNKPGPKNPQVSNTCWVEDVAAVHIHALDEGRIKNGQSLVVQSDGVTGAVWANGKKIVESKFPKAVEKGILLNGGWPETKELSFDVSETERLVGMKFVGFEQQIGDIAEQYLEFVGAEKA